MNKKLIYGVGINDADYAVTINENIGDGRQKQIWICPFYQKWRSMLRRCYSKSFVTNNPTYARCFVTKEWLTFSNFKAWMETQNWKDKSLDKDLLLPGNKLYAPETCVFIDSVINTFIIECNKSRGQWPVGVYWDKRLQKFRTQCSDPSTGDRGYLGIFDDPQEAHQAWLMRKRELAKFLANEQTDPRVGRALIERYESYGEEKIYESN